MNPKIVFFLQEKVKPQTGIDGFMYLSKSFFYYKIFTFQKITDEAKK